VGYIQQVFSGAGEVSKAVTFHRLDYFIDEVTAGLILLIPCSLVLLVASYFAHGAYTRNQEGVL
jgi:hypothetical protein